MQQAPPDVPVWESADIVEPQPANTVTWFHRNAFSIVPLTLKHQGLGEFKNLVADPLVNRTFGGRILAHDFVADGTAAIQSAAPTRRFHVQVVTHSAQTESVGGWKDQVRELAKKTADPAAAARETASWWNDFWRRSWIFVEGEQGEAVTRAYVLQRWMTAAAGRGEYPIKFNGSIFTVEPEVQRRAGDQRRLAPVGRLLLVAEHAAAVLPDDRARRLRRTGAAVPHVRRRGAARAGPLEGLLRRRRRRISPRR